MALSTNLVAYWKLDGNSNDSVGSNNGTDTNITYNSSYGKINQGALFDTSFTSYVTLPNLNIGTGDFTISLWLYAVSWDNNKRIWASSVSAGSPFNNFEINYNTTNGFNVNHYNGSSDLTVHNGTSAPSTGSFHFITVVRSGDNLTLYVDGSSYATGTGWTGRDCSGNNIQVIGLSGSNSLSSYLDEVGVWTRALSAGEVTQLYNSGNGNQYPFGTATTMSVLTGAFIVTGQNVVLNTGRKLIAGVTNFAITGINVSLKTGRGFIARVAEFIITGNPVNLIPSGRTVWTNSSKPSTSWTKPNKPSTNWTDKTKL